MTIFLEEMMLYLPDIIDSKSISELNFVETVLKHLELGSVIPRPRYLQLIKQSESHDVAP
jgi:hypothetical protein